MTSFDDWFENYERDGGELMLYNTIDLEAAYRAGMLRAAEIAHNEGSIQCSYCDDIVAAIPKEAESDQTR